MNREQLLQHLCMMAMTQKAYSWAAAQYYAKLLNMPELPAMLTAEMRERLFVGPHKPGG